MDAKPEALQSLAPLVFPAKSLPTVEGTMYRVYSDKTNFVTVQADNAQDALTKSGITTALRVLREDTCQRVLLTGDAFRQGAVSEQSMIN